MNVESSNGVQFKLKESFAEGGEASIWSIAGQPNWVAKVFHQPTTDKEQKLLAMVDSPPDNVEKLAATWPNQMIYRKGQFLGALAGNL